MQGEKRNRPTTRMLMVAGLALGMMGGSVWAQQDDQVSAEDQTVSAQAQTQIDEEMIRAALPDLSMMFAKAMAGGPAAPKQEFTPYKKVIEGYTKVTSSADGSRSFYTLWKRTKDGQMLAELPRNFASQKIFMGWSISSGIPTAGVQVGDLYAYWKRFDKQLALVQPNFAFRTTGDAESKAGLKRVHTDRVVLNVPILTMSPSGGPVIDLDQLLVGRAGEFFGGRVRGAQTSLISIANAKAFPENVEVAFTVPLADGQFSTLSYSISNLPENTGYKPRAADARIGYFVTSYVDVGKPGNEETHTRYINRWRLEKADPSLKLSPPKEPIVFYIEHTTPVRYRRWVREALTMWNKAYEAVGIVNAIEVYQQDARTGAHMEKDPEDSRYNFIRWTNAGMGFAIGPSRVHPKTGQILDADIVMDEGFIRSYARWYRKLLPQIAMEGFGPETISWLEKNPRWDPRVRLASPAEREQVMLGIQQQRMMRMANLAVAHPAANSSVQLMGSGQYDGLAGRLSQINGGCMDAMMRSMDVALFNTFGNEILGDEGHRSLAEPPEDDGDDIDLGDIPLPDDLPPEMKAMILAKLKEMKAAGQLDGLEEMMAEKKASEPEEPEADDDDGEDEDEADKGDDEKEEMLDGLPESFIGPLIRDVLMHEVGHTLGLRHNFKASTVYELSEINSAEMKELPNTGSVMDYNPVNINFKDGPEQGAYTMMDIGTYDFWAIEYGYTMKKGDLKKIASRVAENDLAYATDEDTWGPDPRARRFDFGKDPLNYADSTMRLVKDLRSKLLESAVKDGQSWEKVTEGYNILLGRQITAISIAANWVGGSYVNRDRMGDPGGRDPIENIPPEVQRRAMNFVIDNAFNDEAYGLSSELLNKMSLDKWWDVENFMSLFEDPTYQVHDRIMGIQASSLTQLLNPMTLRRVYDNEFRVPDSEEALTLPEVMFTISDAIWSELDDGPDGKKYTTRKPMISSLRRDLQREHLERMIDLILPKSQSGAASKPIANLSLMKLREIQGKVDHILTSGNASHLDPYTAAHLSEAGIRIAKVLDAQYLYNTDDISSGPSLPSFLFGLQQQQQQGR